MVTYTKIESNYNLCTFSLCLLSIETIVTKICIFAGISANIGNFIIGVFYIFCVFSCMREIRFFKQYLAGISILFLFFGVSWCLFTFTRKYIISLSFEILKIAIIYLPALIAFTNIDDHKRLLDVIKKPVYILLVLLCVSQLISPLGAMEFGVRLSVLYMLALATYETSGGKIYKLILFVTVWFNFMAGRQALIILVIGLCIFLLGRINNRKGIFVMIVVAFLLAILSFILYEEFIELLLRLFNKLGIDGRGIEKLSSGELFDMSNRNNLYSTLIYHIRKNGILPSGIFADRYYLELHGFNGYFAHNIVIEIFSDFGLLFGSILCIALLILLIKAFKKSQNFQRRLYIYVFIFTIVRLMVSSSFIIDGNFYILIGLIFGILKKNVVLDENLSHRNQIKMKTFIRRIT